MRKYNTCLWNHTFAALLGGLLLASAAGAGAADNGPQFAGFSAKVSGDIYGQPRVIEDMDGDGKQDLIFGATDGKVHVYSSTGKEIIRPPNWPKQTGAPILSDVSVADLDGDGSSEVIVSSLNGKVYCMDRRGVQKWEVNTRGTIRLSSPEVADIDGTGNMSVFIGSKAGTVSRIDKDGRLIWEVPMSTSVSSRVVAADINGDGTKELVAKDDNGKVTILNMRGSVESGWPQSTVPNLTWPFEVGAGDVNGDGIKEIFTTTPEKKFLLWNRDGSLRTQFGLSDASHSAPRLADLNGDGHDEFVIGQADGVVMVCDREGKPLPGWPFKTRHSVYHTPQVIDVDGDGRLDVVFTAWNPEGVGKQAGYVMALSRDGNPLPGYPKYIGKSIAPLTFADLDDDGYLEMIAAGGINYTDDQLHVLPTGARVQIRLAILGSEVSF